ncbi:unnamed protein product [Heterobilharzia americana]|nr:unnamed protein product [Heterobilharzia americana]CAH8543190.1 unnamed protein product [Heterobilharzia americana]
MLRHIHCVQAARRQYGLWQFRYAGHSTADKINVQVMTLVTLPIGAFLTYTAICNEHKHEEEVKEKEQFTVIYPREIKKLPWGDGATSLTDTISNRLDLEVKHEVKIPRLIE